MISRNRVSLIGIVAFFFFTSTDWIQGQYSLVKPGDHVRLDIKKMPVMKGTYKGIYGDSVAILLGREHDNITMFILKDQINQVDVLEKTRTTSSHKILMGTLIGATAGLIFGLLVPESHTLDNGGFYYWTRGGTVLLWSAVGAGCGTVAGIGVALVTQAKWTPATLAGTPPVYNPYFTNISVALKIRF
jgi:hypothetical protein